MQKKYLYSWLCLIIVFWVLTQFSWNLKSSELSFQTIPADFKYDGCSSFPDGNYGDCCKTHDDAYFFGGTWQARLQADTKLMRCVMKKPWLGHDILWPLMWVWVRVWGAPIWPTSYRWGFGRDRS